MSFEIIINVFNFLGKVYVLIFLCVLKDRCEVMGKVKQLSHKW